MKNVFAFKIFCMKLHKIQSKLTGKESLQQSNIEQIPRNVKEILQLELPFGEEM